MRSRFVLAILITITIPMLGAGPAAAQSGELETLRQDIFLSFEEGLPRRAAMLIDRYLELDPGDGAMRYNAACAQCRLGDPDAAERHLLDAIKAGFMNFSVMQRDDDLRDVRTRPVFQAIMGARLAADGILSERREREWRATFGPDRYRFDRDEHLKMTFVTTLDDTALGRVRTRVGRQADHLVETLFGSHLQQSIMLAVATEPDAAQIFGDRHVHGTYQHGQRRLIACNLGRALRHELVHVYHQDDMDRRGQEHPIWIQEGLATLYEHFVLDEDGVVTFPPNDRDEAAAILAAQERLPRWPELLGMSRSRFMADPQVAYAQVRSIFAFIASRDLLGDWYHAYTMTFAADPSGGLALAQTFDMSLPAIESAWRQWALEVRAAEPRVDEPELLAGVPHAAPSPAPEPSGDAVAPCPEEIARREAYDAARRQYLFGSYDEVVETLSRLVEDDPAHADARYDLALTFIRLDRPADARRQVDALRTLDPSLASLVMNLLQ